MNNGENWSGEHYFGYLDTCKHLNDPPTKPLTPLSSEKKMSPLAEKILFGLCIFDILAFIFLLIVGA